MHNHSTGVLRLFYISKPVLGACIWKNVRKKHNSLITIIGQTKFLYKNKTALSNCMHNHSTGILRLFYISKHVLGACIWKM